MKELDTNHLEWITHVPNSRPVVKGKQTKPNTITTFYCKIMWRYTLLFYLQIIQKKKILGESLLQSKIVYKMYMPNEQHSNKPL